MKFKILLLLIIIFSKVLYGQSKLPILNANSKSISIKEGRSYYKDVWEISPETELDVFYANPVEGRSRIVFYSDIDSISFDVVRNQKYDFVVLLNRQERAYTQINTYLWNLPSLEPKLVYSRKNTQNLADTIPFTLGFDNRIHLLGRINDSDTLDLIYDTGAGICAITSSLIGSKVKIKLD
ncbi:MAG: hypothetical protein ACRCVT_11230 [Leadbetterella sp.]